ncbi:MAG TPA: S9 family peptidase [Thermomicrobiaceae bacterium]|nr:S9 family peptidase [Thermomicrobiaceae bacterium]
MVVWTAGPSSQPADHPESALWIAAIDGSQPAEQFTWPDGADHAPRWSLDGHAIAFLSDRANRGVDSLYLISPDGGEARCLVERKRSITAFDWSPDGRQIAFLAPDNPTEEDERRQRERDDAKVYGEDWHPNRLWLVDVSTGETTQLAGGERHVSQLAWSPDGSAVAYVSHDTPEIESMLTATLSIVPAAGGEPRTIGAPPGRSAHGLLWSPDGSSLLYVSPHDPIPQGSSTVYVTDIETGESLAIGTTRDEEACTRGVFAVPGSERVVLAVAQGLSTRLEWLDATTGEREPLWQPESGDLNDGSLVEVDGNLTLAVVKVAGGQPAEVFAGPINALRQLSHHHDALADYAWGSQERVYWKAPDGLPIDGILIRPPDAPEGRLPLVVLVHGGPYGRSGDEWHLRGLRWGQWLAHHGYAILLPNYRGGMGHGNAFAAYARGGVGAGGDFSDVMSGVDAMIERGIADPERLAIGGWSQGGFMTAWAVTQTDRFKAGIMGAGVTDWGMMSMTSDMPTFESVLGGDRPWDGIGPHHFATLSPISFAKNAKTPLLILHGENDARVPVTQAIGFERALREQGVNVKLVVYPREPHGVRERNHQLDILRRVRDWCDLWLKPSEDDQSETM